MILTEIWATNPNETLQKLILNNLLFKMQNIFCKGFSFNDELIFESDNPDFDGDNIDTIRKSYLQQHS